MKRPQQIPRLYFRDRVRAMHAKTLTKIVRGSRETTGVAPSYPLSVSRGLFLRPVTAVIIAIPRARGN